MADELGKLAHGKSRNLDGSLPSLSETPPAKARGVLVACPSLLLYCEHSVALDGRLQDFGADAL